MKINSRQSFIVLRAILFFLISTSARAADLSSVFGEVNSTLDQIQTWVIGPLCYFLCTLGAIKVIYDVIYTKRAAWHDMKGFCIGVILLGFVPTIIKALLKYTG